MPTIITCKAGLANTLITANKFNTTSPVLAWSCSAFYNILTAGLSCKSIWAHTKVAVDLIKTRASKARILQAFVHLLFTIDASETRWAVASVSV